MMKDAKNDKDNCQLVGLRVLKGFASRSAVAEASGLSEPTCWRIENNQPARPENLKIYADTVGIAFDELVLLREGERQKKLFVAARALVLPVELWERLDNRALLGKKSNHALVAELLAGALG